MNFLDLRTVIISQVLTDIICSIVLAFLWWQNHQRFKGTGYWLLNFICQTLAAVLIGFRGQIPDWISIGFPDILIVSGAILSYIGLTHFFEIKVSQILSFILLTGIVFTNIFFAFFSPSLQVRDFSVSVGLAVVCCQCVRFLLTRVERTRRPLSREVGIVFLLFALVSMIRIVILLVFPVPIIDFFQSDLYNTLIVMGYQLLLILLTFSFILLINRRLLNDVRFQEEKFARAFHSSPYAISLTRLSDGKIQEVNDGFLSITGYSLIEVIGKTSHELRLWVKEKDRSEVVREISKGEHVTGREFRFRKKSGEVMIGQFSTKMIRIDDQPWLLSSISDITERKKVANEKEILARFSAENPNPILRISKAGIILYANAASQPLLESWKSRVGKPVPSKWRSLIAKSLKSKIHHAVEFRYGDRAFSCAISPNPIMSYVNVYATDITKRKRSEEALATDRNLLRTMIDTLPDLIYVMDTQGRKSVSNIADWQACGVKKMEDVIGKTDFDTYPADLAEKFWTTSKSVIDSGVPVFNQEERGFDSQGKPIWVLSTKVPIRDSRGKVIGLVGIGRDISERKKANEDLVASRSAALNMMEDAVEARSQLEQLNVGLQKEIEERRKAEAEVHKLNVELEQRVQERTAALAAANKELGAFSYSVSHDLRAPLRSMTGFSEALLEEYKAALDPHATDYLHRISDAARRMGRLVDDLLRLSRVTRAEIKKVRMDLSVTAKEIAGELHTANPKRQVRWVITPNLLVDADPELMRIVLSNLLGNAWKFTSKREHATIEFGCKYAENQLLYYVKDNGAGFDPQFVSKLFAPFQRLHKQEDYDGEGIGLSLVQRIIQRHGGAIWAEAQPDEGAAFYFTLHESFIGEKNGKKNNPSSGRQPG